MESTMYNYICFFKALNVGKVRRIKMIELEKIFKDLGYLNYYSYIQSGNIYFTSKQPVDFQQFSNAINAKLPFEVELLLIDSEQFIKNVREIPFANLTNVHLSFVKTEQIELDNLIITDNEDIIAAGNRVIYLQSQVNYSDSKYSNKYIENKLQTIATTRNYKTVFKMYQHVCAATCVSPDMER